MADLGRLGKLIKSLRGKESLRDASKRIGISHTYLDTVEKGFDKRSGKPVKPTPETLKLISQAYNYNYEELMMFAGYISSLTILVRSMAKRQGELENEAKNNYLTDKEKEEYELIQEFFKEDPNDDITIIIRKCNELKEFNKAFELEKNKKQVTVAGKEFDLTKEDYVAFLELKKHPIMFNDLKSDPEAKVKELIKLYKMKKMFLEDDKEEYGDGFGELED